MRPLHASLFVLLLIPASCGTGTGDIVTEEADPGAAAVTETSSTTSTTTSSTTTTSSSTSTTSSTTTTSTTTTSTTTTLPLDLQRDGEGVPINGQTSGVLRTPTGWTVPVVEVLDDGWMVWTPCGRLDTLPAGDYIEHVDVVLDPGHGGSEPGAVGPGGTRESDLNLQVSRRTRDALEAAGFSVLMTRDADVRVPIVTRGEIAQALDPIAFLSIHHNAGTDAVSSTPGTEMYFQLASAESRRLAGLLYEETRAVLDPLGSTWFALSDAGTMGRPDRSGNDYYGVLRRPGPVTSVLIEFAYLTNPAEEELLNRADVQDALAGVVVSAVDRFLETSDPGSGFIDEPIFRGYGPSGAGRTDDCTDPDLRG